MQLSRHARSGEVVLTSVLFADKLCLLTEHGEGKGLLRTSHLITAHFCASRIFGPCAATPLGHHNVLWPAGINSCTVFVAHTCLSLLVSQKSLLHPSLL